MKVKLGDISQIITGPFGSQLHMRDYVSNGYPVIMPQNISNRRVNEIGIARIDDSNFNRLIRYSVQTNDIIYARRGKVDEHAFINGSNKMICGTGCFRVRVVSRDVYPLFLSLYLNRTETRRWLISQAVGSNMPNLNTDILSEVPLELPEYREQVKIARCLQSIDDKINCNNTISDNLEQMAFDTYMHLFFKKAPNGKLGEIIEENAKSTVQVGAAKEQNGKFPFFTSGDAILEWNSGMVEGRNCYLNTGGNAGVKFYIGQAAYSTDTWCITANNNLTDYLYLLLKSILPELNKKFFQGTGLKHLQKPLLKDRSIYIPSETETEDFNLQVQLMFDMISANIRENQGLICLKDWLLPMLMNGQATVSD